ncbi:hypothetical protein Pmani_031490 [Petrolisthes manimaculis]|uniref:Uncharacterized protein n=1 Tax=Petrolisthes manimaculis TaxID=1843537 RepID=A0AAE1NTJ8_9EUCA|nr:hypothetical protein Pmani_031490 [Petrolisthes manimaculis]
MIYECPGCGRLERQVSEPSNIPREIAEHLLSTRFFPTFSNNINSSTDGDLHVPAPTMPKWMRATFNRYLYPKENPRIRAHRNIFSGVKNNRVFRRMSAILCVKYNFGPRVTKLAAEYITALRILRRPPSRDRRKRWPMMD